MGMEFGQVGVVNCDTSPLLRLSAAIRHQKIKLGELGFVLHIRPSLYDPDGDGCSGFSSD